MAFQISSDVFIWLRYYKPSPSSPPHSPPSSRNDLLTPANLGLPCVFKCSRVFVSVIDWEPVCVCVCASYLSVCQLVYLCVCVCICGASWCDDLWGHTSAALEHKTCHKAAHGCVVVTTSLSRLI